MRYPTISKAQLAELAPARLATGNCDVDGHVAWSGDGESLDLTEVAELASQLNADLDEFRQSQYRADRDLFEGRAAAHLHAVLSALPLLVLDDPGFWRYLALAYYWDLIVWREASTLDSSEYVKYRAYIDATSPSECVLLRMYLRGQIALDGGSYELATAVPRGTDFWRSHILRVRTSSTPVISRAFVREQSRDRMGTEELRAYARRLNRVRSNIVFDIYEADEAAALLAELREHGRSHRHVDNE